MRKTIKNNKIKKRKCEQNQHLHPSALLLIEQVQMEGNYSDETKLFIRRALTLTPALSPQSG